MHPACRLLYAFLLAAACALGQSTQAMITGTVLNSRNGVPLPNVTISYSSPDKGVNGTVRTNLGGHYFIPLLSPGSYNVRVETPEFQAQELYGLGLSVAARLELDFQLRPLRDVWEQGQSGSLISPGSRTVVTFFGPDVDAGFLSTQRKDFGTRGALETSVSQVVDSRQVMELPLAGRDVYTMLVTQPGVSVDTATSRSLGLSSNGQRASASNFLLDGVENNNSLVSGPLTPIAPEMVQEYRISTNNFSAEFGRASGFIANAVTRTGSNSWHGVGYFYLKNEKLNANDFQSNLTGQSRLNLSETQPGFSIGGPIRRDRIFFSSAFEHLRSRSTQAPSCLVIPSTSFRNGSLTPLTKDLLSRFPISPDVTGAPLCNVGGAMPLNAEGRWFAKPVSVDRNVLMERVDAPLQGGKHKLMGRYALSRVGRPTYLWSPYSDFTSGFDDNSDSLAIAVSSQISPQFTNEIRAGYSHQDVRLERAHPEVPYLNSQDGALLPGSPATSTLQYGGKSWELQDTAMWLKDRHIITAGGGVLLRDLDGALTASRDGEYYFSNLDSFAAASPTFVRFSLDRAALPAFSAAPFDRTYKYNQFFLFAQDTFRINRRVVMNFGIRYESLGAPQNVGATKDVVIQPLSGSTSGTIIPDRTVLPTDGGNQEIYRADRNNWAPRIGISIDPTGSGRTLLRAAWGMFYDRPFENIWMNLRNNRFLLTRAYAALPNVSFLSPAQQVIPSYTGNTLQSRFPVLTYIRPDLQSAVAQSYFAGIQHRFSDSVTAEVNYLGSTGRQLISTDLLNRTAPDASGYVTFPTVGSFSYRANDGYSDYHAGTALMRWQGARGFLQAAYTWSHAIDNQSEVLRNDYFDLSPVRLTAQNQRDDTSAFTIEGNRSIDRGNADFDQRQNFVTLASYEIPSLRGNSLLTKVLSNWRVSQLGAFRSGTPFTVYANSTSVATIVNNRANIVSPDSTSASREVTGGRQVLSASGFSNPAANVVGNSGRNAFQSPGFWNVDLSVAKSLALPWMSESGRLTLRADLFNVFNHANLNAPSNTLGPGFGMANYGRNSPPSGLPALAPLNETARQIQLMLRVQF